MRGHCVSENTRSLSATPPRIAAVGEVLWDVFPDGPRFGGAPANVACHAAALGAPVAIVSCVGQDALGDQAAAFLQRHAVDTSHLQRSRHYATGTVQVQVDAAGKPTFTIAAPAAWDDIGWNTSLADLASTLQAVCYGSLGQRSDVSRRTIQQFVAATSDSCLRVLDINLRPPFIDDAVLRQSLQLANVLKLNDEELPRVAALTGTRGSEQQQLCELRQQWNLHLVALTRGARGSLLQTADATSELPGQAVTVVDTVGAGDSFAAALIAGLLRGEQLDAVHRRAAQLAAYVCTQAGAVPELPDALFKT